MSSSTDVMNGNGSSVLVLKPFPLTPLQRPEFHISVDPPGRHIRRRPAPIKVLNTHQGSCYPRLVAPRRRADHALLSVVQEAHVRGGGSPGLDGLGHALGVPGANQDDVARACRELDAQVRAFRTRRLDDQYPYLMVETVHHKYRDNGRLQSAAVVIAAAIRIDGERDIVGFDLVSVLDQSYWTEFFGGLVARGLQGVRLVTSPALPGIKDAARRAFPESAWQVCREHFMRTAFSLLPENVDPEIARDLRAIFNSGDLDEAKAAVQHLRAALGSRHPKLASYVEQMGADTVSSFGFPRQHRERVWSTAILDRLMREVNRQCRVVGVFPTRQSLLRLVGAVAEDRNEEWAAGFRYFSPQSMSRLVASTATG